MEHRIRDGRQERSVEIMRGAFDFTRAALILVMGFLLLFGNKVQQIATLDPVMRYLFAGLCLLYGGFRLYRTFKRGY